MVSEKLHLRYSRRTRFAFIFVAIFDLVFTCCMCFLLPYDGSLSLFAWYAAIAIMWLVAALCIYAVLLSFFNFFEVNGRSVLVHRFLLPDKKFSLDDIDGIRVYDGGRSGIQMTLFSNKKRMLMLKKGELESNALRELFFAQNYPPRLHKGETMQSFAVKTHKGTMLWVVPLCLVIALVGFSTEGLTVIAVAWLIMTTAMLICFAFERKIYVDGNELKSGRLKMSTAHISELYYDETVKGINTVSELRRRDSGECFAKLSLEQQNSYALLLWLKEHGIDCPKLMKMIN